MPLSWNEIRANALSFAKEWEDASREDADAKSFWDEFFQVFGVKRRTVAAFEEPVRRLSGQWGYIDLFWPGTMLAEHKSRGKDLSRANAQAMSYIRALVDSGRSDEAPRYVIVSDFERIALHDLEPERDPELPLLERLPATLEFKLSELHKHIHAFAFIPGYQRHHFADQSPINIEAAERLGSLRDVLERSGYTGHDLERALVRLLFCLFADDTGIFDPRDAFHLYLENHTRADGSDLGLHLAEIFDLLDTPVNKRSKNVPEDLAGLPYVNGGLFAERLRIAHFDRESREALLRCCRFDWSAISPAIFGALFQSVLEKKERRQIGAHYTSERDIMKVVRSLFLDELRDEYEKIKQDRRRLREFHLSLGRRKFLDPACGCGNFLVICYRELRLLELDVLVALGDAQQMTDIRTLSRVDVDQFFGIEIEEWPARIAEVALWLMDHQMNLRVAETFGRYYVRLPLKKSPTIVHANALRLDWKTILPPDDDTCVLGNPPFVGKKEQNEEQKRDVAHTWGKVPGSGVLDYVTCWYRVAAAYIKGTRVRVGFVSTNSITQGEQVGTLWGDLYSNWGLHIHFAHTTFAWQSEASGKAHVHVVIIGFAVFASSRPVIFHYDTVKGDPHASLAKNINPYLTDAPSVVLRTRTRPLNGAPTISYGSMMIDKPRSSDDKEGLIISSEERANLLAEAPALKPYIRQLLGGEEFLNGTTRWCLWLVDASPAVMRESPRLRARLEGVRRFRKSSNRVQTQRLAETPALFGEIRQPDTSYLLIPKVSSESRRYIPIGFIEPEIIASGSALVVPDATLFDFGVLSSAMHNAWMRRVCGRMKSDYQYSNNIVYNNFPWPEAPTEAQRKAVEVAARSVLDAREALSSSSLAEMYDPLSMPASLSRAHTALDRAVDRCYRSQPFDSDLRRVEFLFSLYQKLTSSQLSLPASKAPAKRAKRP